MVEVMHGKEAFRNSPYFRVASMGMRLASFRRPEQIPPSRRGSRLTSVKGVSLLSWFGGCRSRRPGGLSLIISKTLGRVAASVASAAREPRAAWAAAAAAAAGGARPASKVLASANVTILEAFLRV